IAAGGQKETLERLAALNAGLAGALTDIITDLSFQDLTGQRLKKLIGAIGTIRETVFDLYVSTWLMLKTREETPERDLEEIAAESRKTVEVIKNSELKGPQLGASQANVDDLLASLGL
ncbi:MAG: protein phosphatase CheZ, partial [Desulfovibrio sp.]|nr:protein phosphatase CheZ [Desulfovibrio sp.]